MPNIDTDNAWGNPESIEWVERWGHAVWVHDNWLWCAPLDRDGVDWDNAGEVCDMTEVTPTDMDNLCHDLGLTSWPGMAALPGEFTRP